MASLSLKKFIPLHADTESCQRLSLDLLEENAKALAFVPCAASQALSVGLAPLFEGGTFVRQVGPFFWAQVMVEKKSVPASAVRARLDELVQKILNDEGRKMRRKEKQEAKERIKEELLAAALPVRSAFALLLDSGSHRLLLGTTGDARISQALNILSGLVPGIELANVDYDPAVAKTLSEFLLDEEADGDFTADSSLALKRPDTKAAARFSQFNLHVPEVQAHLKAGMAVVSMDMTFDDRVSFNLNDVGVVSKIKLLDVKEDKSSTGSEAEDLDAFLLLQAEETKALLDSLLSFLSAKAPEAHFQ